MTDQCKAKDEMPENPDEFAGEPVEPEHGLDISQFEEEEE